MLSSFSRKKISDLLKPIAKKLNFLDPNIITFISIPFSVFSALSFYYNEFFLSFLFFLISSFMDVLDGVIAKSNKKTTHVGNYFDAISDRMNEFILFTAITFSGYAIESFLAFSSSLLVSYAKSRAEMIKSLNNMDWPSIGERAERLIIILIMLLIRVFTKELFGVEVIRGFLYFLFLISILGFFQRVFFAISYLKK